MEAGTRIRISDDSQWLRGPADKTPRNGDEGVITRMVDDHAIYVELDGKPAPTGNLGRALYSEEVEPIEIPAEVA